LLAEIHRKRKRMKGATMPTFNYMKVQSSGQFLNIFDASTSNGALACQGTTNTTDNFLWEIAPAGDGFFFLQVASSGQFLNILDASQANSAVACQGTNKTTENFMWQFVRPVSPMTAPPALGTPFLLRVKSSGQYLNILNGSTANGAEACQGTDYTTENYLWELSAAPGGRFFLKVASSGQYLNILGASLANGAEACQGNNNTTLNFMWEIIPAGDGFFFLQVASSGQYLNIAGASTAIGAPACQGKDKTTDNFMWQFVQPVSPMTAPPTPGTPFLLKVKSSGQYLNVLGDSMANGAPACQGTNYTTDNFLWTIVAPGNLPAPGAGLGSNSNYILFDNCTPLRDISVTINVTEDIICQSASGPTAGFSFQLNAYSPKGETCAWQQYVVALFDSELVGSVDNWPLSGPNIINDFFNMAAMPSAKIPAGWQIKISLQNDVDGNISGATYVVTDNQGHTQANVPLQLLSLPGVTTADLAPIIAFELNVVGPVNGESAVLSSGAGTITYAASSTLTVLNQEPPCAESGYVTGETANTVYSVLPASPNTMFTQTFTLSPTGAPMIRKQGKLRPGLIVPPGR
jgi:hypothetical protein